MEERDLKSPKAFDLAGNEASKDVILMLVHGFTGNPSDLRSLGYYLNDAGYHVKGIQLPGHGTTPEEMNVTRWSDWWQHVLRSYETLAADYETVIPVGYSMGGLLSLKLAMEKPVKGVVSLASPIFLGDRLAHLAWVIKYFKKYVAKNVTIDEQLVAESAAYTKTPIACVQSLVQLLKSVKGSLSGLRVPIFIGQGLADKTALPKSAAFIHRTVATSDKQLKVYPDITHGILNNPKQAEIFSDVLGFLRGLHDPVSQGAG